ncbi:hypothetical protein VWZ85_00255 [Phaeobacter sp. JH20_29]|uniref:hypothetical protein n=2 Tax=unclassified Phaeobacter TaxID=2621772 RepID=UPI003A84F15B
MMPSSTCATGLRVFPSAALALVLMSLPAVAVDKPQEQAVNRVVNTIDWGAANTAQADASKSDQRLIAAFIDTAPAGLDDVTLPVLILGTDAKVELPAFRGQENAYSAYYRLDGAQLSVMGARTLLTEVPGLSFKHEARKYESTGDGADHMFSRFGGFYTLRITCDAPTEDVRCIEPGYLAELAQTVTVVKGAVQ